MRGFIQSLFRRRARSPLERAEAEAVARLDCQRVHAARSLKAKATINGLLASVDAETRERYEARLAEILSLGGSA